MSVYNQPFHSELSPIFWYVIGQFLHLRLFVFRFHTAIKLKKHYYDQFTRENTHTHGHDISQGHIFFIIIIICAWWCMFSDVDIVQCVFFCQISFLLLQTIIITNDHIWREQQNRTEQNCVQYCTVQHMIRHEVLLGHKTRIVQCCGLCYCCWNFFITFTSIKLFKMIERTRISPHIALQISLFLNPAYSTYGCCVSVCVFESHIGRLK